MAYTASAVIKEARRWLGYHEKASAKDLKSKTGNPGSANYTYFGKVMNSIKPGVMDYPAAWCDCFVDYCHYIAAGKDVAKAESGLCGRFDDYTVDSANLYKKAGRWYSKPKKGDQIFFKNSGGICHTGIVEKVSGGIVTTIEGNSGDTVKRHAYSTATPRIAGYGRPRYDKVGKATIEKPVIAKPAVGQEYVDYVVTAEHGLNFRTGPGLSYPINRVKKKGATMHIGAIQDGWGQTKTGDWGSLEYMQLK